MTSDQALGEANQIAEIQVAVIRGGEKQVEANQVEVVGVARETPVVLTPHPQLSVDHQSVLRMPNGQLLPKEQSALHKIPSEANVQIEVHDQVVLNVLALLEMIVDHAIVSVTPEPEKLEAEKPEAASRIHAHRVEMPLIAMTDGQLPRIDLRNQLVLGPGSMTMISVSMTNRLSNKMISCW